MTRKNYAIYKRFVEAVSCKEKKDWMFFTFDNLSCNNMAVRIRTYYKCMTEKYLNEIAEDVYRTYMQSKQCCVRQIIDRYGLHPHLARRIKELVILRVSFPFVDDPAKVIISLGKKSEEQVRRLASEPYKAKGGCSGVVMVKQGTNRIKELK